jgi:hypothetical protein
MEKILFKGGTTNCLVIGCLIHWVTKAFQYMVVYHADRLGLIFVVIYRYSFFQIFPYEGW